jgi:hypothetical protein
VGDAFRLPVARWRLTLDPARLRFCPRGGGVWEAYTTPEGIKQWNAASDDWHTTSASVDLRKGGTFSSRMEAKDGSVGFDFAGT